MSCLLGSNDRKGKTLLKHEDFLRGKQFIRPRMARRKEARLWEACNRHISGYLLFSFPKEKAA